MPKLGISQVRISSRGRELALAAARAACACLTPSLVCSTSASRCLQASCSWTIVADSSCTI